MNILAIGDPHGDLQAVKKMPVSRADLIILTGDLGKADLMRRYAFDGKDHTNAEHKRAFMQAYDSTIKLADYLCRHAPLVTIFGNVENTDEQTRKLSREFKCKLPSLGKRLGQMGVYVLNSRTMRFDGVSIGGLGYFADASWARTFMPNDDKMRRRAAVETKKSSKALEKFSTLDVLVTHQPPLGYLDKVTSKFVPKEWRGKHAGSRIILEYVRKRQPRYVFCGHVHEAKGRARIGRSEVYNLGECGYKMLHIK